MILRGRSIIQANANVFLERADMDMPMMWNFRVEVTLKTFGAEAKPFLHWEWNKTTRAKLNLNQCIIEAEA
jgi:hypothetical protein